MIYWPQSTNRRANVARSWTGRRESISINPRVMLTSDYVTAYVALNRARLHLVPCAFEPATNRTPEGYDPQFPVCVEESLE
jgi:hypothetical protein